MCSAPQGLYPTLDIWSVASDLNQELLQPASDLPQHLFRDRELVLVLVLEVGEKIDADGLGRWFSMLRDNASRACVLLLADSKQSLPQAKHDEILTDLRLECSKRGEGLNVVLVDLLNFKDSKDLKPLASTIADVALCNVQSMTHPVPRSVLQLAHITSCRLADHADSSSELADREPVVSQAEWLELCELCEVRGEEQRAQALTILASWGVVLTTPKELHQDSFLALSAPWLVKRLCQGAAGP